MSFWEIMSMIGSLILIVLVLLLTYFATRWYADRMGKGGSGKYIKVLDKTVLSAGASLAVVKVGDGYYFLGVGDKNVQLLSELPEAFMEIENAQNQNTQPFSQVFRQLLDKARNPVNHKDSGEPQ